MPGIPRDSSNTSTEADEEWAIHFFHLFFLFIGGRTKQAKCSSRDNSGFSFFFYIFCCCCCCSGMFIEPTIVCIRLVLCSVFAFEIQTRLEEACREGVWLGTISGATADAMLIHATQKWNKLCCNVAYHTNQPTFELVLHTTYERNYHWLGKERWCYGKWRFSWNWCFNFLCITPIYIKKNKTIPEIMNLILN